VSAWRWDDADVHRVRGALVWFALTVIVLGVLYVVWYVAFTLQHGDQAALTGALTRQLLVRR
jgi:hypothetical protein